MSMDILEKICEYLDCNLGDIASFEKDDKGEDKADRLQESSFCSMRQG